MSFVPYQQFRAYLPLVISIAGASPVDFCFLCLLSLILQLKTRVLLLVPNKNNVIFFFNYHKNYVT